jgi:GT2 family glycosyltransferase
VINHPKTASEDPHKDPTIISEETSLSGAGDCWRNRLNFSIMITTRNRLEDLKRTSRALQRLNPPPAEILITADGCTDGTVEFVRTHLPAARLTVNAYGRGSVASRDRMLREAACDLVLALDDDSYPEQTDCLARLAALFAERPRLAVAHFPQHTDEYPATLAQTYFGEAQLTRSFANSGACFRRSIYLQLSGFESRFFHMYEEPDYALQCTEVGFEVYFTPIITIRHHWSGQSRNELRVHRQHARNELWSAALRCPFPFVFPVVAWKMFSQFRFAFRRGPAWLLREPIWWWEAFMGLPGILRNRKPVSWAGYRQWLRLVDKQWQDAVLNNRSFWEERQPAQPTSKVRIINNTQSNKINHG